MADIADVINLPYFKAIIGHTFAIYLLVYLAGLILCSKMNVTMTGISHVLKLCHHDNLYRMLAGIKLSSRILSVFFTNWITSNRTQPGWLMLDDVVIDKDFSKMIAFTGHVYSTSLKRVVVGINIVVLYWTDGNIRIPLDFRLWIPKKKTKHYRTKVDLAIELLTHNENFCKTCSYIAFDSWYCTESILKIASILGLSCSSRLKKNRKVLFQRRMIPITALPCRFHQVELPHFGNVLVYKVRLDDDHEDSYLMNTDVNLTAKGVKKRYRSRWGIEECFRYLKQNLGLGDCQCRKDAAVRNHISLVFLAHFAMEVLSSRLKKNVYETSSYLADKFFAFDEKPPKLKQRKAFLKLVA